MFDAAWKGERPGATAKLTATRGATFALATKPLPASIALLPDYAANHATCVATWHPLLAAGMQVVTPEPFVNDAWRHLFVQDVELISGNRMHYRAGNHYNQIYEAEGSDAALALMTWGYARDTRRLLEPLLDFTRKGLEQRQAGFKLADICRYFWQTRDARHRACAPPALGKSGGLLVETRTGPHGLLPPERSAGDISPSPIRERQRPRVARPPRFERRARRHRRNVRGRPIRRRRPRNPPDRPRGIAASARRETTPRFVPIPLHRHEPAHDPLICSRIRSYWNIIIGYTIGSGIFPPGSAEETWIPRYQEQHGGIFMGLVRSGGDEFNFWTGSERVNPL